MVWARPEAARLGGGGQETRAQTPVTTEDRGLGPGSGSGVEPFPGRAGLGEMLTCDGGWWVVQSLRCLREPGVGIWSHLQGAGLRERDHPEVGRYGEEEPRRAAGGGTPGLQSPVSPKPRAGRMQREGWWQLPVPVGGGAQKPEEKAWPLQGSTAPSSGRESWDPKAGPSALAGGVDGPTEVGGQHGDQRQGRPSGSQPRSHSKAMTEESRPQT